MLSFFKNDNFLSRSLRKLGEWAQAEIDFFLYFMGPRDTLLDIGAFIGTDLALLKKPLYKYEVCHKERPPVF